MSAHSNQAERLAIGSARSGWLLQGALRLMVGAVTFLVVLSVPSDAQQCPTYSEYTGNGCFFFDGTAYNVCCTNQQYYCTGQAVGPLWCPPGTPLRGSRLRVTAGKTYCHAHSVPAFGYLRSSACGNHTTPKPSPRSFS